MSYKTPMFIKNSFFLFLGGGGGSTWHLLCCGRQCTSLQDNFLYLAKVSIPFFSFSSVLCENVERCQEEEMLLNRVLFSKFCFLFQLFLD